LLEKTLLCGRRNLEY